MVRARSTRDDVKTEARELAAIAIEDNISKDRIEYYRQNVRGNLIKSIFEHDFTIADITETLL
jgi:hypothetical protein